MACRPLAALPPSLLLFTIAASPVPAQTATSAQNAPASPEAIKQREQELEAARAQQKAVSDSQARLKAEIAAIGQDRSKLNRQLIDIAAQVRNVETSIADAEGRLRPLDAREQAIRASLDSRRSEIVEVLAALQRAGRRTPPALLVRPEDALRSLRTAMLLGSVVPELRTRATQLVGDLGDERQRQQAGIEKDMEAESTRAIALAKQVDSLQGLIARMEQDVKSAAKAAAAASQNGRSDPALFRNANRTSPAIAFASAKGLFKLPVNGTKIRDFGGSDGAGGIEKGISLATRAGAQVTTPCDGWVVYAGPFRSYGQLLILNAGGGYHVLIAGMERISVNIGQFVLTGEPVATMGSTSQVASILATNASQPVLYVEFRKDGTPIDPGPWWAASEGEKVRG